MHATTARPDVRIREVDGADLGRWDRWIRQFPNHRVVHTRAWLESLEACGFGKPLFLVFERDGRVVGCLPGLLVSLGPWRAFGSPMPGWQTVSMGPAFDPAQISAAAMMETLVPFLEERHRVVHIEILHPNLDADAMRGRGFVGRSVPTFRAPLTPDDPAQTFQAMRTSARRNVRRAERLHLEMRIEHRDQFVDDHYDQLQQVYLRGGHTLPFPKDRIHQCFHSMQRSGNLLAVAAYLPGGRARIATGIFLIEGDELLLWTWAHHPHYRWYRATEAMTWLAMQRAMDHGCDTFDLMGRGQFKAKLGATIDESKRRWIRSRGRWLTHARDVAEAWYRGKQAITGRITRFTTRNLGRRGRTSSRGLLPACVLGDVDLVQALGLAGVSSDVVAPPGTPARFSRFTRQTLPWIDPWDHPDELVEALLAHSAGQPEPPVLFYQDDAALLLVSRHRDRLRNAFRFVIPDHELVQQLVDKAQFQRLAARLDLPVPPSRVLCPSHATLPDDLQFPVLLKPVTHRPDHWAAIGGGAKAVRIDTLGDLQAIWPRLAEVKALLLAQTLVPGPETRVESYHVYIDDRDEVVADFTGTKIRTHPIAYGDSAALEITDAPDVRALGRDVLRRIRLRGVAKLDFKRAPNGRLYLLEVNPRFTLWHHLGAVAGVNIPAIVYEDARGQARPVISRAHAGARWCKPWTDWHAALAHGIPVHRWCSWAMSSDALSAVSWRDPVPLIAAGAVRLFARDTPEQPPSTPPPNVVAPFISQ